MVVKRKHEHLETNKKSVPIIMHIESVLYILIFSTLSVRDRVCIHRRRKITEEHIKLGY